MIAGEEQVDLNFQFTSEQDVQIVSIDDFVTANQLPQPDYIKVDVDGSELSFVKGGKATLQAARLKELMFELQSEDKSSHRITDFLSDCGLVPFRRYEVERGLFNIWFKRPPSDNMPNTAAPFGSGQSI